MLVEPEVHKLCTLWACYTWNLDTEDTNVCNCYKQILYVINCYVTLIPLTTHAIRGWPPVDADSCQSTLFSIHLQTGTTDGLVVHVAHVIVAGLLIKLVWDKFMAFLKDPFKKIQVRIKHVTVLYQPQICITVIN